MDHEMAVRLQASEKYLLGELSPVERDQFEEHLADCSRCMDEFWTTDVFAANARAVFEDRAAGRVQRKAYSWLDWFRLKAMPTLAFSGALNLPLPGFSLFLRRTRPLAWICSDLYCARRRRVCKPTLRSRARIPSIFVHYRERYGCTFQTFRGADAGSGVGYARRYNSRGGFESRGIQADRNRFGRKCVR